MSSPALRELQFCFPTATPLRQAARLRAAKRYLAKHPDVFIGRKGFSVFTGEPLTEIGLPGKEVLLYHDVNLVQLARELSRKDPRSRFANAPEKSFDQGPRDPQK